MTSCEKDVFDDDYDNAFGLLPPYRKGRIVKPREQSFDLFYNKKNSKKISNKNPIDYADSEFVIQQIGRAHV